MTHASQMHLRPRALAWAIFCSITLAACGGGGGLVRAPEPAATPPPPPVASQGVCEYSANGDCVLRRRGDGGVGYIYGDVTSSHALIKVDDHYVDMRSGRFQYDGGTRVEKGGLILRDDAALHSNARVLHGAWLAIEGTLEGDVTTDAGSESTPGGSLRLYGTIKGNVLNGGVTRVSIYEQQYIASKPLNRIEGSFQQTGSGVLEIALPYLDNTVPFTITGRADLAGTLSLYRYESSQFHAPPYPLPTSAVAIQVLRADGGVFGTFDQWTSPGLFIEGSLRYGSNDVWFDLKRVSVQAAMTSAGAAPLTIASATNFDRALAGADRLAGVPSTSLSNAQQGFLQSAGKLLWMSDPTQAKRSLDSLSGSMHADALHRAGQGDAMSSALGQRLLTLQPGQVAGNWSQSGGDGTAAGFDQWLGSRLLLGASTSIGNSMEAGGQARDHERQAALYLRWFGDDGWYAGGSAGFARHALTVDRQIDLGPGGRWNAHSLRGISVASIDAEAGRRFAIGGGVLAPYASVGTQVLRSERALEQGSTGFELALQANTQARLSADLGLRYGKRWQFGEGSWLQLDADARMQHGLADAGSTLQAAFIGVPDVVFALPGSLGNTAGWVSLGVRGGAASGWRWSLGHAGSFAGPRPERQWSLGLQRSF